MKTMKLMGTSVLAFALATGPLLAQMTAVGDGEGELNIVAWPGYIERGESDAAYDWVTKFEAASGCKVNVKTANTSD
jgi:putative spermidine/putrescine transport system substrate-binding protein